MSETEHGKTAESSAKLIKDVEAATIVGVSIATWRRMVKAKTSPQPVRLSPSCVRWQIDEIHSWISDLAVQRDAGKEVQ